MPMLDATYIYTPSELLNIKVFNKLSSAIAYMRCIRENPIELLLNYYWIILES